MTMYDLPFQMNQFELCLERKPETLHRKSVPPPIIIFLVAPLKTFKIIKKF